MTEVAESFAGENILEEDMPEVEEKDEITLAFEGWLEEEISEDEMIENLHNDFELSYPAAVNKLRALKKAAGLTRPRGHTGEIVRAFIKELHDAGKDRKEIIESLIEKFKYTAKSASSTFSTQAGKLGLLGEAGAKKHPLDVVVAFCRENQNLKRAEFIEKMEEELDYTSSTAGSFYNYVAFAQEYMKQEKSGVTYEEVLASHQKPEEVEEVEEAEEERNRITKLNNF